MQRIFHDTPIHELDRPIARRCEPRIVRDEQHCAIELGVESTKQLEHAFGRMRIEIPGGLVRQQQCWPRHERARDRDSLLLTAR